jgi:hypothetical protein
VEVPLADSDQDPLGFIVWVEVDASDYERLLKFRKDKQAKPAPRWLVAGPLANPVSGVRGSFGTPVKFKVLKDDPTPYIKWGAPGSSLEKLIQKGASRKFWHDLAARCS